VVEKKDSMAYQLSGGNKRKLSVAIAMCGGSKFVLLDEPTSGMDLSARRELWNMMREHKKDRVMLLTTHYMDEADILGDRIGIMSGGKMTCLGSSMFLKNKFGVGYHVSIEKESAEVNQKVLPYFMNHLGPGVRLFTEVGSEMSLTVPTEYSGRFKDFFTTLDD
jgi:ATP-binding cassette, subfamily A (ABC1), member 3